MAIRKKAADRTVQRSPGIRVSHGVPRLDPGRRRDLQAIPAVADSEPRRTDRRPYRSARHAVLTTLTRAQSGADGAEAAELARRALCVYRGAVLELGAAGAAKGPSVHAHLVNWATQLVTSQRLAMLASAAGLGTRRGLGLIAESQRAAGRAERSWTAAILAAGLLRGRAQDPGSDVLGDIAEASRPRVAAP